MTLILPWNESLHQTRHGTKRWVQGEPYASSFRNGGLRTAFDARGYKGWEVMSPAYVLVDQLFFHMRSDLINAGRTLFDAKPPKA